MLQLFAVSDAVEQLLAKLIKGLFELVFLVGLEVFVEGA